MYERQRPFVLIVLLLAAQPLIESGRRFLIVAQSVIAFVESYVREGTGWARRATRAASVEEELKDDLWLRQEADEDNYLVGLSI